MGGDVGLKSDGDFISRVASCKSLYGLEVKTIWLAPTTVMILARHPYGSWHGVTVFKCDGEKGVSENGAPMHHGDVAFRLKKMMRAGVKDQVPRE